jgi:hypothetical protein
LEFTGDYLSFGEIMAENSTYIRKWSLLFNSLAGLMSIIFLNACTNVEQLPLITITTAHSTLPPSFTPAPAAYTKQPASTPSKTATQMILPSPTSTTTITPTHTPFPRDLDHYILKYDPNATPDIPPIWSISVSNIWGNSIPATPVEVTPQFIAYLPPADLATNAQDLFIQAGCIVDQYNIYCPPESQLSRFDCWWIFADTSWIAYPMNQDLSLVVECSTEIDYSEKAPEDLYIAGCAFQFKVGYIFKIKEEYVLVNTIEQMKELFVPIESSSTALSYAQMMTGLNAFFDPSFDPTLLYLQESIEGTHVSEVAGSYIMNLYHTRVCGCEPNMTSEVMIQVDRDGTITWNNAIPVYFTTGFSCAD